MRLLVSIAVLASLAGPAGAQLPVEAHPDPLTLLPSADARLAANKKLVFDFWREVVQARHVEKIAAYVAESFIDHDPAAGAGGRAALAATLARRPPEPLKPTIDDLVAITAERDLVVLAFRRELQDLEHEGQTYTTTGFDMLRVADGRIVEHWTYATLD
ncbi:MAG TPA: nuclear transport factor 2 family protein [Gammaproteobacteria bacterium]|jgi:predicted SnoaL-like aldol condensation-catalyzing enzyme|nr:nuclear transport factor 2 family protein [Gammaproteobacteria bacterium]